MASLTQMSRQSIIFPFPLFFSLAFGVHGRISPRLAFLPLWAAFCGFVRWDVILYGKSKLSLVQLPHHQHFSDGVQEA